MEPVIFRLVAQCFNQLRAPSYRFVEIIFYLSMKLIGRDCKQSDYDRIEVKKIIFGHLNMQKLIPVINQLDAQFFLLMCFVSILYMFRATSCSSSGESVASIQHLVYGTLKNIEWSKITKGISKNALLIAGDKILVKLLHERFMA